MPFTTVPWSELRARLKARLELKAFWTDEECLAAFNEGLQLFNLLTGRWHARVTIFTYPGPLGHLTPYLYTIPASLLYLQRVEFSNQPPNALAFTGVPLSSSSVEDLTNARPRWREESTISGGDVPLHPTIFAPIDLRQFVIWPFDAGDTNVLTLDGIAVTPVLAADDDTLDLGTELTNILLGYALHALAFKKGGPFFASTQPYWQAFLRACAEENDQIKSSQIFRRLMGWERRDLKPLRGGVTLLDPIAQRTP